MPSANHRSSEQLKTRREVREAVEGTTAVAEAKRVEVATESGLRYVDIVVGGGDAPKNGYLLAADVVATVVGDGDEARSHPSHWFPSTPSAILKDFLSRRAFLRAQGPSLSIPTHLDAFQLRF